MERWPASTRGRACSAHPQREGVFDGITGAQRSFRARARDRTRRTPPTARRPPGHGRRRARVTGPEPMARIQSRMLSLARAPCSVVPNPPVSVEAVGQELELEGVAPGDEDLDSGIRRHTGGGGGHRERRAVRPSRTPPPAGSRADRHRPPCRRLAGEDGEGLGLLDPFGASAPPQPAIRTIAASAAACRRAPPGRRAKGHFMRRWTSKRPCYSSVRSEGQPSSEEQVGANRRAAETTRRHPVRRLRPRPLGPRQVPGPRRREPRASLRLVLHELVVLTTSWVPGALGLVLRKLAYPLPARRRGPQRHLRPRRGAAPPRRRCASGDDVVVDDLVVLDAKGTANRGIVVGNGVFLGRGTILSCKDGDIVLGDHVNIGFHSRDLLRVDGHRRPLRPLRRVHVPRRRRPCVRRARARRCIEQARESRGIHLGDNVWLGAGALGHGRRPHRRRRGGGRGRGGDRRPARRARWRSASPRASCAPARPAPPAHDRSAAHPGRDVRRAVRAGRPPHDRRGDGGRAAPRRATSRTCWSRRRTASAARRPPTSPPG